MIKGLEAMVIESFTAARHYGVEDALVASLQETFPGIDWERQAAYFFQRVIEHGRRRAEEMREAAQTVREAGLASWSAAGTAERQAEIAALADAGRLRRARRRRLRPQRRLARRGRSNPRRPEPEPETTHDLDLTTARRFSAAWPWPLAPGVRAQDIPSKPIRLIVGYSAGGAVDIIARAIGQHLQTGLGQPVIVDNRPGAGTNIATKALIDSAPDGTTLMLAANALAANVSLFQPAPYALDRITPIALVGRVPVVLAANPRSPASIR